jgi:signal transduction histidine kinase/ActR/RegA family two-component response regulator
MGCSGETMTSPSDSTEERVLILTAFIGDAAHTVRLLAAVGVTAEVCKSVTALCRSIEEGAGALFLAEETLAPAAVSALMTTLEKQPAWSDLPIVVSVMERELTDAGYGLVGSLGDLANVSLIERPVNARTMVRAVQGALRARRRQYDARSLIKELALARRQAEESSRAKDEFLATLSHELRTPLNAILGWTRMLKSGTTPPEKRQQVLLTVERNAIAQTRLIEDLLEVSRAVAGKLTITLRSLDPIGLVQAAMDSVQPAAEGKRIRLTSTLDPSAGPILGDADRLQQVICNLLNNAIKFTPAGGRVEVTLERRDADAEITVRDNGVGMNPSFLPYVFDRFRQADSSTTRSHGGLGIGLSIVKSFVELHGGRVAAASDGPGRGSTFVVRIPLAPGVPPPLSFDDCVTEPPPGDPPVGRRSPRLTGLRILVVDDEPESAELLAEVLEGDGATVLVAGSASAAYEMLVREGADILVSDIGMAVEDGYELIRRVRSSAGRPQGRIPAIAVTAYARVEDGARALTAGFDMHASKPIMPIELVAMVETLAKQSRERAPD